MIIEAGKILVHCEVEVHTGYQLEVFKKLANAYTPTPFVIFSYFHCLSVARCSLWLAGLRVHFLELVFFFFFFFLHSVHLSVFVLLLLSCAGCVMLTPV